MSSRFNPGSTLVRPQKPWTSSFYGSMNGPGLKTLHETRILKTWVPKKKTNEDDDEDEDQKWEEEAEVPDLKTSLENADSTKKNHGLKERRTGEEKAA